MLQVSSDPRLEPQTPNMALPVRKSPQHTGLVGSPKKTAAKVLPGTTSIKTADWEFPALLRTEYRPNRGGRAFGFPGDVESIPQSALHKVGTEVKEHGPATRWSHPERAAEYFIGYARPKLHPAPGYRYHSVLHVGISHLLE
jgi:hypothetical protein